jgi:hypothetical protein
LLVAGVGKLVLVDSARVAVKTTEDSEAVEDVVDL